MRSNELALTDINLPADLSERVDQLAEEKGVSRSRLIIELLEAALLSRSGAAGKNRSEGSDKTA